VLLDATKGESGSASRIAAPRSRTGQAFAELGQYVAAALGDGNHVLLVVGTSPGPGSSLVAANLAVALAWTRSDVVLVCADHTETAAPRLLGIGDGRGLPDLLAGTASLPEVTVQPADQLRLRVLPPGPKTPSGPYLQYEPCRRLIAELRREAGFVIIEAQSVGQAAETFALAEFADAALVAVEVGRTQRPAALDCLRRLDRLRTPVLGAAVLSAADARMAARARDIPQPVRAPAPPPRPAERSGARFEPAQPAKPQPADAGHGHVHVTTGRPAAKPDGGGAVNRRPAEPRPRVDATIAADRPNPARNSDPTDQAAGH
jgi:Mrp family chromosome partitioning ATPase